MTWDPDLYAAFAGPRLRPALELMARIGAEAPTKVVDLGCGTGTITRLLARRWPLAEVVGLDSSPHMLAQARREGGPVRWVEASIADWSPSQPVDVLFSNAALHWLDGHQTLFPRLMAAVAPKGWLAVQMPRNHHAPSHTLIAQAVEAGPWADILRPLLRPFPVAEPAFYHGLLAPLAAQLDIWETEYLQVLDGDNPVVRFTMGTTLRPLLEALDEPWRSRFLEDYSRRIRAAYPLGRDGRTLFPFRRLFLVARKAG